MLRTIESSRLFPHLTIRVSKNSTLSPRGRLYSMETGVPDVDACRNPSVNRSASSAGVISGLTEKLLGRNKEFGRIPGMPVQIGAVFIEDEHQVGESVQNGSVADFRFFQGSRGKLMLRTQLIQLLPLHHEKPNCHDQDGNEGKNPVDVHAVHPPSQTNCL